MRNKIHKIFLKRILDIVFSSVILFFTSPLIIFFVVLQTFDTRLFGIFTQKRVGKNGKLFNIFKIRTMKDYKEIKTTVTTSKDKRITKLGSLLRKTKIDELPQFINVLIGDMSIVGPRPDVKEFIDKLSQKDKEFLKMKPGITCLSSILLINEENILATKSNPLKYNEEILWPKKVLLNNEYCKNWSISNDIVIIIKTIYMVFKNIILFK